ncbi:MAG: hypothetical protein ACYC5F_02635 [Thermoleophilia bacterium]
MNHKLRGVLAEMKHRQQVGEEFQVTFCEIVAYPDCDGIIGGDRRSRRVLDIFFGEKQHLLTLPEKRALESLEELARDAAEWTRDQ